MIDFLSHEYGYTPQQILSMPITGAFLLLRRIKERYEKISGKSKKVMAAGELEDMMRV